VLNVDTEMTKAKHRVRVLANIAEVPIQEIETGKFASADFKKHKLSQAIDKLEAMPYYYESVAGKPFEEIMASMRRWVHRVVGVDDNGNTKPCVIIYDYLKLMTSEGLSAYTQEHQLLGFQISQLHDFMVRFNVACFALIQLNRDGITREDTDVASGSDRQIWLCDNFSLFKKKSEDETAKDAHSGNRKLVPLVARDGAGLEDKDYINMTFRGQFNKIIEGKTYSQIAAEKEKQSQGFVTDVKPSENIQFD
jgi:hypothetical protein